MELSIERALECNFMCHALNTMMATLADALKVHSSLGCTFSGSSRSMHVLQYADDTWLVAGGPASCQRMLERVESWLEWTGMRCWPKLEPGSISRTR